MMVKSRLPILMASKGVRSVSELARLTGDEKNSRALYRLYNNETKSYDPELLAAVCKALSCQIDELLYLDGQAI